MNKSTKKLFGKALSSALALSIGVCTVFGGMITSYATDCEHGFETTWSYDSVNHWHASTCGHNIISDAEPHHYENGRCTECGAHEPAEEHVHTFDETEWRSDENNHWRASTCEHYIIKDMSAHNFENGFCTVCGTEEPQEPVEPDIPVEPDVPEEPEEPEVKPEFTSVGAYSESLYAEFEAESKEGVTASYKKSGASNWTSVDGELIRYMGNDVVRVDVVGISAGTYSIKVEYDGGEIVKDGVSVSAYDRSGYAHFNATEGVGAYTNDGVPKENAQIIYVTEQTKNTVTAEINGSTYEGIVAILGAAQRSSNPLIVRVIGQISAATWKEGNVTYTKTDDNVDSKGNLLEQYIIGANGQKLPTDADSLTQSALIEGGYNVLDTSRYSVLNGLSSKATYKSGAYDSAWNNCSISNARNVTVEGIGTDAEIFQWGFTWVSGNSIEVRNITFDDYTEDACSFEGSSNKTSPDDFSSQRIWVHNCTFNEGKNYWDVSDEQDKREGDGATDFKRCSYVTVSYNHYFNNHKTGLVGADNSSMTANVTFHHNFYDQCQSRLPLARQANMHMYNNYYYGSTGTNMSLRARAYAFIEYCYFDDASHPIDTVEDTLNSETVYGVAKVFNCMFTGKSENAYGEYVKIVSNRTATVSNLNSFNQNFDTDPDYFYYDSVNKKSNVADLITDVSKIPELIPQLAGVNK